MSTLSNRLTTRPASRRFGLVATIKTKRVVLPLKGVECDFSVASSLAWVTVTQIFRQENEKPLDCEYLFPLPADASVYFCEADINGHVIRAQVREREEARRLAAEKKAAGFRTALVEAERENLFTLSLGNVQPGDLVIIQIKYVQTLRSLAGKPSLEIPFCPGHRYIPGKPLVRSNKGKGIEDDTDEVPDASRITPVRIDAEHPDAAFIDVRGTLDGKFINDQDLVSPSHQVALQRTGDQLRVALSDKGEVPDRDFVLRWTEQKPEAVVSRAWIQEKGKAAYALLEIRAPQQAAGGRVPCDFYFLVDRSGSMSGEKWEKATEALQSCVKVLGAEDRAMITFFESDFKDFAEKPLDARVLLDDHKFQSIRQMGTDGGTELRRALQHVLKVAAQYSSGRPRNLILITDAQIGNDSAILELMKTAPDFPVHCFGIDVALNDSLLLALCGQQGGTFHSLNPNDDIERAVTALGQTLGQPVLLDLHLSAGWEPAEARIPNLYAGQVHFLSARCSNGEPLELSAHTPGSEPIKIQFQCQATTAEAPYLHWCHSHIQRLVAEGNQSAAIALSVESNLVCPLTAFIAWDESEKVPVATHDLVQPSLEPDQVLYCLRMPDLGGEHLQAADYRSFSPRMASRAMGYRSGILGCDNSPQLQLGAPDELDLKRKLSDLCHRAGVADWQTLVKAIFDWIAKARDDERWRRIGLVADLVREIEPHVARMAKLRAPRKQKQIDAARGQVHRLLKAFADNLAMPK